MIRDEAVEYLKLVFSDADLIDVDFSLWDSVVSVYVVADHVPYPSQGKRGLLAVRFGGVRRFDWSFRHHTFTKFPVKVDENQHLNWNIYRAQISRADVSALTLSGSEQFPVLRIEFEDVYFESVEHSTFADVNPDWSKPGSGLARPSIERLHELTKRS